MKKLATLLLAAGLVFSASQPAAAVEIKPFMQADFMFETNQNRGNNGSFVFQSTKDFNRNYGPNGYINLAPNGSQVSGKAGAVANQHNKHFYASQRFLIGGTFIANENLSAYVDMICGFFTWGGPAEGVGGPANGGALGTRAANIALRQAYMDWMVPNTNVKVRMGQQLWILPGFSTGSVNPTDGNEWGSGILVNAPINDMVSVTAGWLRAASDPRRGSSNAAPTSIYHDDNIDMFVVTVPFKFDGARITPWATVSLIGKDETSYGAAYDWKGYTPLPSAAYAALQSQGKSNVAGIFGSDAGKIGVARGNSTAYWLGLGGELTKFQPFRFAMDINYSAIDTKHSAFDRSGWFVSGSAAYKTAYGVPTMKAWYASGDDDDITNGSERPLSTGAFGPGASTFFGGSLAGPVFWNTSNGRTGGSWGISAQWNNASFIPDMFHNFRVTYFQGTNDKRNAHWADPRFIDKYMTTADSGVEIDLDTTYSIYKNLAVLVEMAYIFQNFDGDLWAKYRAGSPTAALQERTTGVSSLHFSNAWRIGMNLRYTF